MLYSYVMERIVFVVNWSILGTKDLSISNFNKSNEKARQRVYFPAACCKVELPLRFEVCERLSFYRSAFASFPGKPAVVCEFPWRGQRPRRRFPEVPEYQRAGCRAHVCAGLSPIPLPGAAREELGILKSRTLTIDFDLPPGKMCDTRRLQCGFHESSTIPACRQLFQSHFSEKPLQVYSSLPALH